jgi:hypothetical protein
MLKATQSPRPYLCRICRAEIGRMVGNGALLIGLVEVLSRALLRCPVCKHTWSWRPSACRDEESVG